MSEYSHPFTNENGKVLCQICGKPYLVISPKHLANHKVTYAEYKMRFPDAPLSSKEFAAKGKYGKEKHLFVKETLEEMESDIDAEELNEPDVEDEIDFKKIIEDNPVSGDICDISKDRILDHLRTFLTNVKKDFIIQQFSIVGDLVYEVITDFADPVLKINIEFPKTFWHNQESFSDNTRDRKLAEYGWKVIKINSVKPTFQDISKAMNSL